MFDADRHHTLIHGHTLSRGVGGWGGRQFALSSCQDEATVLAQLRTVHWSPETGTLPFGCLVDETTLHKTRFRRDERYTVL